MPQRPRNLPHLYLRNHGESKKYTSPRRGNTPPPPYRDRVKHAEKLERAIGEAIAEARQQLESRLSEIAVGQPGFYLEFEVSADKANAFENLENRTKKIELVSVKPSLEQEEMVIATVFVPESATDFFLEKVEQYRDKNNKPSETFKRKKIELIVWLLLIRLLIRYLKLNTIPIIWLLFRQYNSIAGILFLRKFFNPSLDRLIFAVFILPGNPKNESLITRVNNVEIGTVQSLFTDDNSLFPNNDQEIWWEVWLRRGQFDDFQTIAQRLEIPTKSHINFPERIVALAMANVEKMEQLIKNSDTVAELRIAKDTPSCFLEMGPIEQQQWVEDLCNRTLPPDDDAVAVCLLDTGVNWRHQLIEKGLDSSDLHTCDPTWGTHDHQGHGTQMAGLVLYSDLFDALASTGYITLVHRLESVKLLPPPPRENDLELYGAITEQAVSLPEIQTPKRERIFCMAITSPQPSPNYGTPSSWSAAIDQLCFGEDNFKRLMIIAVGNIRDERFPSDDYLAINDINTVENPGQAWNALIIGAYTEKVNIIHPDFQGWQSVAPCGDLSPRSRTSVSWQNQWPIRPDVVFEGGNCASDGQNSAQNLDNLSLLTTYHRPDKRLFESMSDTSCATALASYMAARILSEKPKYLPETIRALIVHSAEWTSAMKGHFEKASSQTNKGPLLRRYGYGVPDLERALKSSNNDLTLIVEDQLHPLLKEKGEIKTKNMNFHDLPWPTEQLEALGETNVELKVTLSYFIEPNPGERGWKRKHCYASYGLRFEVKKPLETDMEFQKRINKAAREEEENTPTSRESDNWFLGPNLRNKGSLHSDIWTGTAADLADRGMIGVCPVGGWWKEKPHLERWNQSVRYSLIITIRVPEIECDIYTPVFEEIQNIQFVKTATEIEN